MDSDDSFLDEYYYYNEEDEDDEEDENVSPYPGTYCGFPPSFLFSQNYSLPRPRYITPEEAERNAQDLLKEEEREKEKADKKRLKKKRQKDRKRQQKLQEAESGKTSPEERTVTETRTPDNNNGGRTAEADNEDTTPQNSTPSASDDELDLGSTFVLQAQKKMESKPRPERRERAKEASRDRASDRSKERPPQPERGEDGGRTQPPTAAPQPPTAAPQPPNNMNVLDRYKIQESLDLANIGNNMASRERFPEAEHYYTEAITLNPSEYRFLGNRSYVYERLGRYEEARRDAETALRMQPHFLKGHFRKGKALKGLKRYSEAIAAFQQVLLFDMNHVEAAGEIAQCQQRMQEAMTSTRVKILSSAPLSPPATPPTSVPGQNNKVFVPRNIYNAKCEAAKSSADAAGNHLVPERAPGVIGHSKLYPVWVGNVTDKITENILRAKFQPFGLIHSIRILYSRTCAFINYTAKGSAEAAFRSLQGLNVEGTIFVLQLRNPEHDACRAPGAMMIGK